MTSKKLAGYVTVDGATYGPDDDLPGDVAEKIDNPKAWEESETRTPTQVVGDEASAAVLAAAEPKSRRTSTK